MKLHWLSKFALSLVLLGTGCGPSAPAAKPKAPPPEVSVVEVVPRDIPVYGEWVGTLDGLVNAKIKAQVSGYLTQQLYKEGTVVRQGQPLFQLDPRPFEALVAQAQGTVSQSKGQFEQAQSAKRQAEAALSQARSQMLQAQAGLQQANGQRLQADAAYAQALANQKKTELDLDKYLPLLEAKAVTQQDVDNARQLNKVAQAQVQSAAALIASAVGTIDAAKAQIESAKSTMAAAQAQIGSAQASITTALAQGESAQAALQSARLNLEFTHILSPIDGLAGVASAEVGDLVGPTSDPLTLVSKVDPIKVIFPIPEQEYLENLRCTPATWQRRAERSKVEFELIQSDGSKYPRTGKFYSEDRGVGVSSGSLMLTVTFPNPDQSLRPGQYAKIRAIRYIEKGAILIPQRAVSELQDRRQVAVVGPDKKVSLRAIKVGPRQGSQWIVLEGLKAGESVIVEGLQKVSDGAVVLSKPYP